MIEKSNIEIICLESPAFWTLVKEITDKVKQENNLNEAKWITAEEAMQLLHVGKSTLQKLRNSGSIRFTTLLSQKPILYDRQSILDFLDSNAQETF